MKLLFWNLKGNDVSALIKKSLVESNIDIALFAEHAGIDFNLLVNSLDHKYRIIEGFGGCDEIVLLVSSEVSALTIREQDRYVLYSVATGETKYIVAGVHLQDRRSSDTSLRLEIIRSLMTKVRSIEKSSNCPNIIVVGDFNANPYDAELLQMNAFHAVLFKDVIERSETRRVGGKEYRRLYNPILNYLSEDTKTYGSYYYASGSSTPVWHCLDQVLVSKSLMNSIISLQYLKLIGNVPLMNGVRPNPNISDHLPLFVQFI